MSKCSSSFDIFHLSSLPVSIIKQKTEMSANERQEAFKHNGIKSELSSSCTAVQHLWFVCCQLKSPQSSPVSTRSLDFHLNVLRLVIQGKEKGKEFLNNFKFSPWVFVPFFKISDSFHFVWLHLHFQFWLFVGTPVGYSVKGKPVCFPIFLFLYAYHLHGVWRNKRRVIRSFMLSNFVF